VSAAPEPRLRAIPAGELGDEARAVLREQFQGGAERLLSEGPDAVHPPNVLGTLMHHPQLASRWLADNNVLLNEPSIDPKLRELMILRVAWRTRSPYEWTQHVRIAKQLGMTDEQVETIAGTCDADPWTPLEADLLSATDELIDSYVIDDHTWSRLAEHFDERQLLEIVFIVRSYTCLAMAFNSFGIQLDPDLHDVDAPAIPDEGARGAHRY
jgi:4-carboxymuconolactone decarboxylase